jgi:hypothetical protein
MRNFHLALLASVVGVSSLVGCAPENVIDGSGGSNASSGSGNGGDGEGGEASAGNGFGPGAGMGGSTGNTMECASTAIEAELAPLTMFIAYDKSGSMQNNNKWNNAKAGMKSFFADPTMEEVEVALRFFPNGQCDENSCNVDACAMPDVDVGALTAESIPSDIHEQLLNNALDVIFPNGATPMRAALEGGIQWALAYETLHRHNKIVVILVTDGEPNGCGSIGNVASVAAEGFAQGIVTYAVGLEGSNEGQMQQVAQAGGGKSFFIGNGNASADLLAALQEIRGEQLACELLIPMPQDGQPFQPNLVNVKYTKGPMLGGGEEQFGNVPNEAACVDGGWYYNDPTNPETIILCPQTCDRVSLDPEGSLQVLLGCETQPA